MHIIGTILGTVLAVLGWTLLTILALVLIILILPVRIHVELKESALSVQARLFGFFPLSVWPLPTKNASKPKRPRREKAPPKAEETPAEPQTAQTEPPSAEKDKPEETDKQADKGRPEENGAGEKKKKKKFAVTWALIQDILSAAGILMRRTLRALHFRKIAVVFPVHKEDAAATAQACGQMQAAVGAGIAFLENFLDLRFDGVCILPDFTGDISAGPYLFFELTMYPIALAAAGLCALWHLAVRYIGGKIESTKKKPVEKTEETA